MTQHTDLIERLHRQSAELADTGRTLDYSAGVAGANALEAQAREIEGLRKDAERITNNRDMWKSQCERQADELWKLRKDAERVFTYKNQPGNLEAWRFGEACREAQPGGDPIDHGLSLLQKLQEKGYGIVAIDAAKEGQP